MIIATGHLEKCVFSAIAASAPYSNPHIRYVYCGSPCGASLHSRKNRCFSRCRSIGHLEKCVFSAIAASAPYSNPHILPYSYTLCILRFSVRRFLALTQKPLFFEVPYMWDKAIWASESLRRRIISPSLASERLICALVGSTGVRRYSLMSIVWCRSQLDQASLETLKKIFLPRFACRSGASRPSAVYA